nr:hypothetical protein [Tanacetum cinerariifolium]
MISSLKIDSLLAEFAGELIFLESILPGVDEANCDPEEVIHLVERLLYDNSSPRPPEEFVSKNSNANEVIHLVERLLYDNSSPRPPEEFVSKNSNANVESFFPSPIPNEDSDSLMKEIDLSYTLDDPISSSIEDDDDDSERDILIHEELLDNYSLSLSENESFRFDIPSFSRPLSKPPDGNTGILNIKMMGDISKQKAHMPRLMITRTSNGSKWISQVGFEANAHGVLGRRCRSDMNRHAFYNNGDDDDEDYTIAITSDFLITDSLSMGYEHRDTIPKKESDEFNKSSVEDLVPNPSEFEDECKCDVPDCDDSQMTKISTFSNPLFDDSTSSDDESSHEEIDSLLAEFAGDLIFLEWIPPGVDKANCDPEEDIHLVERLLYEIDLFLTPDDPMPLSIEDDDDEPERDVLIHEELLHNYSLSLPVNESFHFDIPSFSRPLAKPPDVNMSSLADKAILSGADNRPPMLKKDMYDSWRSRMELYMLNRQHGRMILESVEHAKAIQADCDVKATNIILQALPSKIYALVSTHKVAKVLWERIQMLMQGTSLTKQERECKLYDAFDKFAYQKGETLGDFYLRFSLLLNDMNMYNMNLEQSQVNTKFLNTLPLEWSKFVTDVKLVRDLHTTNVDQLHAYLGQHEYHANEVRLMHERTLDPLALISQHQLHRPTYQHHQQSYHQPQFQQQSSTYQASLYATSYHTPQFVLQGPSSSTHSISYLVTDTSSLVNQNAYMASFSAPQIDYALMVQQSLEYSPPKARLVVPVFQKGDDHIDAINHMMSFLTAEGY